jgi:hypothetical protein
VNVEDTIRENRTYGKRLSETVFTVSVQSKGAIVKFGKKLNIVKAPNKEAAQILTDNLNAAVNRQVSMINEFIDLMSQKCQQISIFDEPKTKE